MANIIACRPPSIRLAISISPSRVSSSTVPISRMYMRTGSVVTEVGIHSRQGGFGFFLGIVVGRRDRGVAAHQQGFGIGRLVVDRDAHVVEGADDAVDRFRVD